MLRMTTTATTLPVALAAALAVVPQPALAKGSERAASAPAGATAAGSAVAVGGIAAAATAASPTDEILVIAKRDGYVLTESTAGTKTETPLVEVPQIIAIVGAEQIRDQALRSMNDVVRFTPGVAGAQGEGHRDQLSLRGNNSTADFFVDGLRDDSQYYRSLYNIERVEVLKGANAAIFGRGGGGGVINRVLKAPRDTGSFGLALLGVDQFGAVAAEGDYNLAFNNGAARLTAMVERLDNHRPLFEGTRWGINPSVAWRVGGSHKVQLSFEHVEDDRFVDRGVPSMNNRPLTDARDLVFGDRAANRTRFNGDIVRLRTEHELGGGFSASFNSVYGDYDKGYSNIYASGPVLVGADGSRTVPIGAYADTQDRVNLIGQANLLWEGEALGLSHRLLVGVEHSRQDTDVERINGQFTAPDGTMVRGLTLPLPTQGARGIVTAPVRFIAGPTVSGNRAASSDVRVWSAYVQDQVTLTPWLSLLAGLRFDSIDIGVTNRFTGISAGRSDDVWSPRGAVIVTPTKDSSLYLSYGRSYLPQAGDQFAALDAVSQTLRPERFDSWELGGKWASPGGLLISAAIYRLDRLNGRATGPVAGTVVQTGAQRSQGVELQAAGRVRPGWHLSAGYAYIDADYRAGDLAGRRVAQVPRHTVSLWSKHDVTDALVVGIGASHQSRMFASTSNTVVIPAQTRVDAMAALKLTGQVRVQLNIDNLLDAELVPNAHNDNNLTVGAPRTARLTLSAGF